MLMNKEIKLFANGLIPFFSSKSPLGRFSGNAHMFHEDISQHKMPYSDRLERFPDFKATIKGAGESEARELLSSISEHHRPCSDIGSFRMRYSDTEIICDVINNISKSAYYWGKVLISKKVKSDGEYVFVKVYPQSILKILNLYIQYVPYDDRQDFKSMFRFEKDSDVFSLSIFNSLFSRIQFKIVEFLLILTDGIFPRFVMKDNFQNKYFDTNYYKLLEIQFMTLLTKKYAWKLRFSADEYTNEYSQIYASYRSAIYDAQVREVLIDQLNKMLHHFKIDAIISVEGIPTSKYLKESILQLERGEKSFRQALDEAYLR